MKKILPFSEHIRGKFELGQWIVPLTELIPIKAYKIIAQHSPEVNRQIGAHSEWSYQVRNDNNLRFEFRESQLREATQEEIEFAKAVKSYNL